MSMQPSGAGGPMQSEGAPYAEWWKRFAAAIIDGFIVGIPATIVLQMIGPSAGQPADTAANPGQGFFAVYIFSWLLFAGLNAIYFTYFHGEKGQTPGKTAMKIQVRDVVTRGPIGYGRAFQRLLVANLLAIFTCGIGGLIDGLWPLWDPKKQALHDKAVKSIVVDLG